MTDLEQSGNTPEAPLPGEARSIAIDTRSDVELLLTTSADPAAFGEFYVRYANRVYGYFRTRCASSQDAYDLVSETFAQALDSIDGFDPTKGEPSAWLFGIAKNKHRHYARRGAVETRARHKLELATTPIASDTLERLEDSIDLRDVHEQLEPAILSLPESTRAAVRRRCLDGATYEEIALDLNIRPAAARKRVSRGLRQLELYIGDNPFESHD